MTAALLLLAVLQQPNLILEVRLDGSGQATTVEAELLADSTLLLPSGDLGAFLGTPPEPAPWIALGTLRTRFPTVTWQWIPRALLLLVTDPGQVLPLTRRFYAQIVRQGQGAAPYAVITSGPFAAFAFDQVGRELWQGGYSWRGRLAISAQRSTNAAVGTSWTVSAVPSPLFYASYTGGPTPQAAARVAVGPAWLSTTWQQGQALITDALVNLGRVSAFASSRKAFAITVRGPLDVQVGRVGSLTTGRVSFGPIPPNPFVVPVVP
jgi:hypothetical protein